MKHWQFNTLLGLIFALGISLIAAAFLWGRLDDAELESRIAQNNARAQADSTHHYRQVADTTQQVVGRLQLQAAVKDSLLFAVSRSLAAVMHDQHVTAQAVSALAVRFDSVTRTTASTATTQDTAGRHDHFTMQGPPIGGTLDVTTPRDSARPASLASKLAVSPFTITMGLGCDPQHAPVIDASTPTWVHTDVALGTVNPQVCNSVSARGLGSRLRDAGIGGGIVIVSKLVLDFFRDHH